MSQLLNVSAAGTDVRKAETSIVQLIPASNQIIANIGDLSSKFRASNGTKIFNAYVNFSNVIADSMNNLILSLNNINATMYDIINNCIEDLAGIARFSPTPASGKVNKIAIAAYSETGLEGTIPGVINATDGIQSSMNKVKQIADDIVISYKQLYSNASNFPSLATNASKAADSVRTFMETVSSAAKQFSLVFQETASSYASANDAWTASLSDIIGSVSGIGEGFSTISADVSLGSFNFSNGH